MQTNLHFCIWGEAIPRELLSTSIAIQITDGGEAPISVLKIAAPFQNAVPLPGDQYLYLRDHLLAHSVGIDNILKLIYL